MRNSYQQLEERPSASGSASPSYNNLPGDLKSLIMNNVRLMDCLAYMMADKEIHELFRDYSVLFKLINMHQSSASLDRLSALTSTTLRGDKIEENLELFLRLVTRIWCARMREQNHQDSHLIHAYLDRLSDLVNRLSVEGNNLEATIIQFKGCLKAQYASALLGSNATIISLILMFAIFSLLCIVVLLLLPLITQQNQKTFETAVDVIAFVLLVTSCVTSVNTYQYVRCSNHVITALNAEQESEMTFSRNSLEGLFSWRAVERAFCDVVRELGDTKMDQFEELRLI